MNSLLKGVVRDHRLPADYKVKFTQPTNSAGFLEKCRRMFWTHIITRQHQKLPLFWFWGITLPIFTLYSLNRLRVTGSLPQILQPSYYLYRDNLAYYGHQVGANANPDNHYNRQSNRWTTDPACGLDIAPKRPWLDLKDPSKNLYKLKRDGDKNVHVDANGWRGY